MMTSLPLAGVTIGVTRAKEQSRSFIKKIEAQGGIAVAVPLLAFQSPKDKQPIQKALSHLHTYDWLVITSANGVHFFLNEVDEMDKRSELMTKQIAVVGTKTEEVLQSYGLTASLLPDQFVAESLLEKLQTNLHKDSHILLVKGNLSRDVLYDGLKEDGFSVEEVTVYETVENEEVEDNLVHMLTNHKLDYLTFTSPSTVQHFINMVNKNHLTLDEQITFVCIGPITAQAAEQWNLQPLLVAKEFTTEGMIQEIIEHKGRPKHV
ncbi:uroporphyrinogen-III synthase [Alkalihalobacterium chitinilyticum]|uniref:Uroporphyrinogen-III synthase n=1 Tax=Alkalihalobacterium chitinilyticum TaxID=2980103 RepID=A0ABT5VAE3_9BACI|nr:uroporphyrinogen-III synthase [Alkalihalobacterium chitinilyticum]MDE5412420.1 uroporphyrinogen-III synthase [Alkalihalobacterium chitinilyticum]